MLKASPRISIKGTGDVSVRSYCIPEEFICPLTLDIMREPVVDRLGNTYERDAIFAWIRDHRTCPMTRRKMGPRDVIRNQLLRSRIEKWRAQHDLEDDDETDDDSVDQCYGILDEGVDGDECNNGSKLNTRPRHQREPQILITLPENFVAQHRSGVLSPSRSGMHVHEDGTLNVESIIATQGAIRVVLPSDTSGELRQPPSNRRRRRFAGVSKLFRKK